ncbi:MAG: type III-B CRISPR module RAMP protein Cmr4 [Gammaproteobacteria bacterium]|nr:MAG: type III-B CRISPR module RAMP protein Cmr4 [Gammaproteobacteria bacterium]
MTQKTAIMGLLAQTSIHAGAGQHTGVIDLPIQREGHNGWPCVFGSAVKGALRNHAEQKYGRGNESVIYVFGPDTTAGNEHAGAVAISDARLLLLPVRSLTSQFKWVTCPAAIKRFFKDTDRFGITISDTPSFSMEKNSALVAEGQEGDPLFLEEYRFKTIGAEFDAIIDLLLQLMKNVVRDDLVKQLVMIDDDNFSHLSQHATPVNAHIAIDSETKIVKPGALWYEETLPPETLLYTGISAVDSRKKHDLNNIDETPPAGMDATQILGAVTDLFAEKCWLQLGGNETVGMGWCAVSVLSDNPKEKGAQS